MSTSHSISCLFVCLCQVFAYLVLVRALKKNNTSAVLECASVINVWNLIFWDTACIPGIMLSFLGCFWSAESCIIVDLPMIIRYKPIVRHFIHCLHCSSFAYLPPLFYISLFAFHSFDTFLPHIFVFSPLTSGSAPLHLVLTRFVHTSATKRNK